jgi:hypothetical protein
MTIKKRDLFPFFLCLYFFLLMCHKIAMNRGLMIESSDVLQVGN